MRQYTIEEMSDIIDNESSDSLITTFDVDLIARYDNGTLSTEQIKKLADYIGDNDTSTSMIKSVTFISAICHRGDKYRQLKWDLINSNDKLKWLADAHIKNSDEYAGAVGFYFD